MKFDRNTAKQICNDSELDLFDDSLGRKLEAHSAAELNQKIKRAREFRNKYQDLFRRQSLEMLDSTGNKQGNSLSANSRTEQKIDLMSEILERFEKQLQTIQEN
ncbi:hypothetical protein KIH41_02835 [Litoribacter ruber]|uniref:Uncharacterized protein n=1 Tax=Litoribacter ruber TaxID=702568 RepID=A0AAP2CJ39_9BACT|nr:MULTISPECIES: hypothetical protein [Litoribacter]MBS9524634.1 hypothetical protein [Litoribacter alkaliphilus]MBT0810208.1 hypothetical protein [Litoribacter ruber]